MPLRQASDRMAPDLWLKYVKIRILQNRLRESRYKPFANTICAVGCRANESLGHIIQLCRSTDVPRHVRHNSLVEMLARKLNAMRHIARIEPRIPTVDPNSRFVCEERYNISCAMWLWDQILPTWIKFNFQRCQNMTCRESTKG